MVSLDPIYLDFDMSESDYLTFSRERASLSGPLADKVDISLSDENRFAGRARSISSTMRSTARAARSMPGPPSPTPTCS